MTQLGWTFNPEEPVYRVKEDLVAINKEIRTRR